MGGSGDDDAARARRHTALINHHPPNEFISYRSAVVFCCYLLDRCSSEAVLQAIISVTCLFSALLIIMYGSYSILLIYLPIHTFNTIVIIFSLFETSK